MQSSDRHGAQLELYPVQSPDKVVNVASVPHRSPFRYPGGKTWFVPFFRVWLRNLECQASELIEPFAGGAICGLSAVFEGRVNRLTLCELDEDVAAVWQAILSDDAESICQLIMGYEVEESTVRATLASTDATIKARAFRTLVRNRVQHGGILAPGASLIRSGESGKGLRSRWYPETLVRRIRAIREHAEKITFVCDDAITLIKSRANSSTVLFVDPPYTAGRNGKRAGKRLYRYNELNHEELFAVVAHSESAFVMTYDDDPEVRALAARFGFNIGRVPMKNTHHNEMWELVISNRLDAFDGTVKVD